MILLLYVRACILKSMNWFDKTRLQSSDNQSRNMEHGIVLVLLTDSAPITPAVNDMSQPAGSEERTRNDCFMWWAYNIGSCDESTLHTQTNKEELFFIYISIYISNLQQEGPILSAEGQCVCRLLFQPNRIHTRFSQLILAFIQLIGMKICSHTH